MNDSCLENEQGLAKKKKGGRISREDRGKKQHDKRGKLPEILHYQNTKCKVWND